MRACPELTKWMENESWCTDGPNGDIVLTDEAPEEARESFKLWQEAMKHPEKYR